MKTGTETRVSWNELDEQFETGSDGTSLSKSTSQRSDDDKTGEAGFVDRMLDERFETRSDGTNLSKTTSKV